MLNLKQLTIDSRYPFYLISLKSNFLIKLALLSILMAYLLTLAGCASRSVKKTPLPQGTLQQLQQQSLAKRLPVPVQGVSRTELRDTWGASRSSGRVHEGIDIMAVQGTKVYSTTDGIISSLKDNQLGGKVIWIIGPQGSWHYYAHLSRHKRGLAEGDLVRKGDLIGYVGNTGNARYTAPHLHYGLYLNGRGRGAVNPYFYLR